MMNGMMVLSGLIEGRSSMSVCVPRGRSLALLGGAALIALALQLALAPPAAALPGPGGARATTPDDPPAGDSGPPPASGSYLAGRFAQHEDDWAAAAEFMAGALSRDPEDLNLLRRTFLLSLGEGRFEQALPLAHQVIERDRDEPLPLVLLAVDDALAGRWQEAQKRAENLGGDGLNRYVKALLQAWLAVGLGTPEAGLKPLEPLTGVPGLTVLHALHAGRIAELAGNGEAARQWFDSAVRNSGASLRVLEATSGFLRRSGRVDEARALIEGHLQANPDSVGPLTLLEPAPDAGATAGAAPPPDLPTVAREELANALFDIASALHQEGSDEVALVYGRIVLRLQPAHGLTHVLLGDLLASRNHDEAAITEYQVASATPLLSWTARLRITESQARLNQDQPAIATLEAMAGERPDRAEPLIRLGDLYRADKHNEPAIAAYDRALARLPTPLDARYWPLLYGRAVALDRAHQWDKAEADLLQAIELAPDQAVLLNYLGYSWVDRGRHLDRARPMIEKAVSLRPKDGYIIDSLGWALYKLKDFPGAVGRLEQAIVLKPLDPTINDHLGDAYWTVGRKTEAVFQWRRALQYVEDDPELKKALEQKLAERADGAQ